MNILHFFGIGTSKLKRTFINGLYYDLRTKNRTATVTRKSDTKPHNDYFISGAVVIPSEVTFEGVTYVVTAIGAAAFRDWTGMVSIVIPDTVTSIGDRAFESCISLSSISIPNSVKHIGAWAFAWCKGLTELVIPDSVTVIEAYLLSSCINLKSIILPKTLTSIGKSSFYDCSSLTSFIVPDTVTHIGYAAFYDNKQLTSITIGKSVSFIDKGAFSNCPNLKTIKVNPDNQNYSSDGTALYTKDKTTLIKVPCGTENFAIPPSVATIGRYALAGCNNMDSVTIPSKVTRIGAIAFSNDIVKELHVEWAIPLNIEKNVFHLGSIRTLYVPVGTKRLYATAEGWKIAINIKEEEIPATE